MKLSDNIKLKWCEFADETLQLAFDEFIACLNRRTGAALSKTGHDIEVEFKINEAAAGYGIAVSGKTITFCGRSPLDILYAVYDFAEDCLGFCFLEIGNDRLTECGPLELNDGTLFADRAEKLKRRGFIQEYPFSKESYALADWMAKNHLNYLLTWMKYYDDVPAELKDYFRVRGIEIESGHHNFNYWIPPEKYCRTHPEFFAVRNGKRISPQLDKSALLLSEQLCTTNPELRREFVKNIIDYCRRHPEIKTVSLTPNDGFGWCECDECSKFYDKDHKGELYSVSEHVYKADRIYHDFVRDVVRQLRVELPDISVTFCAYINYCAPSEGFKLESNMAVHFAPYWRCINHRINDPACQINSCYARDLEQWIKAKTGGEINIYEYLMGVNLYISLPMVHHEDIFDEVDYYQQKGVDGFLTQFHPPHWSVYGLNFYMMAKALAGRDKAESLNRAFRAVFGKDAEAAKDFYAEVKKLVESTGACHVPYPRSLLNRTKLEQYEALNAKALELFMAKPGDRLRRDLTIWTEYMMRFKTLFDLYHAGKAGKAEVLEFHAWIHSHPTSKVFVVEKIDMLLKAWIKCIETGKKWYHFNIDWEDDYVRRHDELLK